MYITADQLQQLREIADEIDRLALASDQLAMPPAFQRKQMYRALPELSARIYALITTIAGLRGDAA